MPSDLDVRQKQRIRRRRFGAVSATGALPDQGNLVWAWDPDAGAGNAAALVGPTSTAITTPVRTAGTPSFYTFGATDFINFGNALDSTWGNPGAFTVHAAVNIQAADIAAANRRTASKDNGASLREWTLSCLLGKPNFFVFYGGTAVNFEGVATNVALTAGRYVLTGVYDPTQAFGSRCKVYVNGVLVAQTPSTTGSTGTILAGTSELLIGTTFNQSVPPVSIQSYVYAYRVAQSAGTIGAISSYLQTTKGWV